MYSGGKLEHKQVMNKYMHITMASYILIIKLTHAQNKAIAVSLFTNHILQIPCHANRHFNNNQ